MGLIKAFTGALGGTLADQWLEYISCDSLTDVLVQKGVRQSSRRGSNTKSSDNLISNGSKIAVGEGQCALIVEDGKVVDFCAEPGGFIWDKSTEPSLFYGGLGRGILDSFQSIGNRFAFGGETGKDQRVYYLNLKELRDSKFGTPTPVPFALTDEQTGYKAVLEISCYGSYSYKITDPVLFFTQVCGNVEKSFHRDDLEPSIKPELLDALNPAFAKISAMRIGYEELPAKTHELKEALNDTLRQYWQEARGIEVQRFNIISMNVANKSVLEEFRSLQQMKVLHNPQMAAAYALHSQGEAMKSAASNANGAMTGLMGMGMMGGNPQGLGAAGLSQLQQAPVPTPVQTPPAASWTCSCGTVNQGKFCSNCGEKEPKPAPKADQGDWTCTCGAENVGRFCYECGERKPVPKRLVCDKCGYTPEPGATLKFCPECGDVINEHDFK